MKKLTAVIAAFILLLSCVSVAAVEEKAPDNTEIVNTVSADKSEPLILGGNEVSDILDDSGKTSTTETTGPETEPVTETVSTEPDEPDGSVQVEFEPTESPMWETTADPGVQLPTSWQPFTQASTCAPVQEATEATANIPDKPAATQAPDGKNSDGRIIIENSPKNSAAALKSRKVKLNFTTATLKCGKRVNLNVKNKNGRKVTFTSDNNKIAKVNKKGIISTLKKGRAKITAKVGKKKLYCIVKVVTSPKLSDSKVKVKKGKTAVVKIIGRASNVKNKYKSTEYALIISKAKADKITVRGLKKGSTVLKIKVNGVILKLNVKVT